MVKTVIKRSSGSFLEQEKHVIIQDFLKSGKSKNEIWREYTGRADHGRLLQWMRDLGYLSSSQQLMPKLASNGFNMSKKKVEPKSSEEEKQLKEAELKAIAFSTMVDIAEKEFKIPIRKKFNTKP
jgi:transposase